MQIADSLPSSAEMAAYDAAAIAAGTPAPELMERAGKAVLNKAEEIAGKELRGRCVILCGPGNNGGDGIVIARLLRKKKRNPTVILTASARYSEECARQAKRYVQAG